MRDEARFGSPTRSFLRGVFLEEESLFAFFLFERVAVPFLLVLMMVVSGGPRSPVLATTGFIGWELTTSVVMRGRLSLLKVRPLLLLSIEQAACVAVFLSVGSWRGTFYYTLASPLVLAAAFVGTRTALLFAVAASAVVITSIGVFHMPDGRGPQDATTVQDWGGAPQLFFAAALLVSLIRVLLDRVTVLGELAASQEPVLVDERQAAAEEMARHDFTRELHDELRNALSALALRWKMLADAPALVAHADGFRRGAALAEASGAELKPLVIGYRPSTTKRPETIPVTEGANIFAELDSRERRYFNAVGIARLALAAALAFFLIDARGSRFWEITWLWVTLILWVLVTSLFWRPLYERLKARPHLLLIEEVVGGALLIFGTGRNGNPFWVMGATAPVLATAVGTMTQALSYTLISSLAAVVSIFVARHFGWQSPPGPSGTVAATVGYFALVLPAVYVRFLFDRLGADALRMRSRAEENERVRPERTLNRTRRAASPQVVAKVHPAVGALRAHLALVDVESQEIAFEREQVTRLVHVLARLQGHHNERPAGGVRDLRGAVEVATERLRALGGAVVITTPVAPLNLAPLRGEALAGVFAEAFANAYRHGSPPIELQLEQEGSDVKVTISDRGGGFDRDEEVARGGLWMLRQLAEAADVALTVESNQLGTRVKVVFSV